MTSGEDSKKVEREGLDEGVVPDEKRPFDLAQLENLEGCESPVMGYTALDEAMRIAKEENAWRDQVENLGAAARFASEVNPTLRQYAQQRAAIDRIFELQSAAASGIDNLESIRALTKRNREKPEFMDSTALMNPNAYRDQRQDEFQDELIRVLKTTSEQTEQTAKLQAQLVAKKEGPWTKWATVLSAVVLIVTVLTYLFPNRSEAPVPAAVASENADPVVEDEALTTPEELTVSEAPTQPEPASTPAHAPADNAPSSSDQRAP